jgi:hypothetical protein
MSRRSSTLVACAALLAVGAVPAGAQVGAEAGAQVSVGPTLAWHDDADFGIGATVAADLDQVAEHLGLMGEFLIFFPDVVDYWEINGNLTYAFPTENTSVQPFALAGLNLARTSVEVVGLGDASSTDLHLNLGGGIVFDAGSFRPRAGGRFVIGDGSALVVFITLPFGVGGS